MSAPQYWLFTRDDGSVTVHRGTCIAHRRRLRLTGPLTAEQVKVMPRDSYRICQLCMSGKFTLSPNAAAARLISR